MIGKTISHYQILAKIGGGGMGVVYTAMDTQLKRTVALKFLPPDLTGDPEAKARFIHEAQAASILQHENICTIHEIGETGDGEWFICMDYYEGETLKDRLSSLKAKGPATMPVSEVLDIAVQVAEGLVKAHEKGIVHRDIKPANLMITKEGVVKILDFGLAKFYGKRQLTQTGKTVGTIAYLSPEQAAGKKVDHRTDIWSIGAVLYEMVTAKRPFDHEYDAAVIYSILDKPPTPPSKTGVSVSPDLENVILKCLQKNPDNRYQTANDLLSDLIKIRKAPEVENADASTEKRGWFFKNRIRLHRVPIKKGSFCLQASPYFFYWA